MTRRSPEAMDEALLDLWRPPAGAGEPVGCLASTFTFDAEHFDRYCLARFLGIESDPDREGLPFVIERETQLSSTYAGVLVDHHHAKGTHSLRWDLLPVRVPGAIQHSKVAILSWTRHLRILVGSANLTQAGYRENRELVTAVDVSESLADIEVLADVVTFLRSVLEFVPAEEGQGPRSRALSFLSGVQRQSRNWKEPPNARGVRRVLAPTLPSGRGGVAQSAWESALREATRDRYPLQSISLASPFFDRGDGDTFAATVYGALAKRGLREVRIAALPLVEEGDRPARLAAPRGLWAMVEGMKCEGMVYQLPLRDQGGELRSWHAKALLLASDRFAALLTGSSNCTSAGLGLGRANIEAGILHVIDLNKEAVPRTWDEIVWDPGRLLESPNRAEWEGSLAEPGEDGTEPVLPMGFKSALYEGGAASWFHLTFDRAALPEKWVVRGIGSETHRLVDSTMLPAGADPIARALPWPESTPPQTLEVAWGDDAVAEWPYNVLDPASVPAPPILGSMSVDDILRVLAASDPGAALRALARGSSSEAGFDPDVDSAAPIDLDPLRRYDLGTTFLHQVRRRARLFERYRAALERPVYTEGALHARLTGVLGAQFLADRMIEEALGAPDGGDHGLMTIADMLFVVSEVRYQVVDGAVPPGRFNALYQPFMATLAQRTVDRTTMLRHSASPDVAAFFDAVVGKCLGTA